MKNASSMWLHGYWGQDWADNYVRVVKLDGAASTVTTDTKTPPVYGKVERICVCVCDILVKELFCLARVRVHTSKQCNPSCQTICLCVTSVTVRCRLSQDCTILRFEYAGVPRLSW